jgi:hypothetical protein
MVRWLWFFSKLVSSLISCVEFASKNYVLNFSKFSGGIEFSILVDIVFAGGCGLAMSMFWGMCKVTR